MHETETCHHCHEELLEGEGVFSHDGLFCGSDCQESFERLKEEGVVETVTQEMIDAAPIVNYRIAMIPHVALDPCPNCGNTTELFGTAIPNQQTHCEPFVMRAIAGKQFVIKCMSCDTVLQVEKPLIEVAKALPGGA